MMGAWLRFFRVVNVPTVPGDVLVGAAAVLADGRAGSFGVAPLLAACLAGVSLYLFGLADNDIVGAATDRNRPIGEGLISLRAARLARGACLFAAMILGAATNLPPLWWGAAFLLAVVIVVYNRTKWCLAMGLCRGLNVVCGGTALIVNPWRDGPVEGGLALLGTAAVWTLYITLVTKYSEGEEGDEAKRRRVGLLISAIIYFQLTALLVFKVIPLLIAGAVLLVVLRLTRRLLPKVSAS